MYSKICVAEVIGGLRPAARLEATVIYNYNMKFQDLTLSLIQSLLCGICTKYVSPLNI